MQPNNLDNNASIAQKQEQAGGTSASSFLGNANTTPEPASGDPIERSQITTQFGAYGTRIFSGFISGEEYNQDLSGHNGITVYDEMRRSDATVSTSLEIINLPIMGAGWEVEAASDDPNDILIAEWVKANLFERIDWVGFVREALLMLPFGFSVFEKVYKQDEWKGNADGEGAGMYWMLDKLASRKQDSIFGWELKDGSAGVRQIDPAGGEHEIPAAKLLIFTNKREGSNFEGISILRSSYKHWYIKSQLEKIMAIAVERQGVGIPYVIPPANATEDDKKKVRIALKNLRANEQAYLEIPVGWEIGFMDMHANTNMDAQPQVAHHDRQILKNVFGQFLDIGAHGSSGTRNVSEDQGRLLEQAIEAVATTFTSVVASNLIKQLVDLNFNVDKYPKLTHDRISDNNVAEISDALQKLMAVNAITPDAELEEALREILHLPELPEDIKNDYANRPGQTQPVLPGQVAPAQDRNSEVPGKNGGSANADNTGKDEIDSKGQGEGEQVTASERKLVDGLRGLHSTLGAQLGALHDTKAG